MGYAIREESLLSGGRSEALKAEKAILRLVPRLRPLSPSLASPESVVFYRLSCGVVARMLGFNRKWVDLLYLVDGICAIRGFCCGFDLQEWQNTDIYNVSNNVSKLLRLNLIVRTPIKRSSVAGRPPSNCFVVSPYGREVLDKVKELYEEYAEEVRKRSSVGYDKQPKKSKKR